MKFIIHGALGRMGQAVEKFLIEENQEYVKVDINFKEGEGYRSISEVKEKTDCIIDFSFHTVTESLLEYAVKTNTPIIVATTGHTEEEKAKIVTASNKVAVFYSGNMSVGIALLSDLVKKVVKADGAEEVTTVYKSVPPDVSAASVWLKNRCPERWRDKPCEDDSLSKVDKILEEINAQANR